MCDIEYEILALEVYQRKFEGARVLLGTSRFTSCGPWFMPVSGYVSQVSTLTGEILRGVFIRLSVLIL